MITIRTLTKNLLYGCLFCWLTGYALSVSATGIRASGPTPNADTTCMYVNLNKLHEQKLVELYHTLICFEYEDVYGTDPFLPMRFYDWQHQLIAQTDMPKQYGRNAYSLDLVQLGIPFNRQIFTLETVNETGKKMTFVFRLNPPPDLPDPVVDILVTPVSLRCNQSTGNLVAFYGTIKGGKAPYQVEWTVANASQSALLYQPRSMKVDKAGQIPAIEITQSPEYVVQLHVTDACGNEGKQIVSVRCQEHKDNPNTLFWQPLPQVPDIRTRTR